MNTVLMHVRCPVAYCGKEILVEQLESWGEVDPLDHGCITVTVTGTAVSEHMRTHTPESIDDARTERTLRHATGAV